MLGCKFDQNALFRIKSGFLSSLVTFSYFVWRNFCSLVAWPQKNLPLSRLLNLHCGKRQQTAALLNIMSSFVYFHYYYKKKIKHFQATSRYDAAGSAGSTHLWNISWLVWARIKIQKVSEPFHQEDFGSWSKVVGSGRKMVGKGRKWSEIVRSG